ncbi:MAG: 3-deoxy-7-phosphoheptulonate synthase [Peptococcaceae bacterium]|jgi:3-deoxy-7-phosphoheptulonate synthase|nr:3-deoxy-7-phosphoheptulonate synthase [Peptococcaceae bacterium]
MVVVMDIEATEEQVQEVNQRLADYGFSSHLIRGVNRIVIGAVGDRSRMGEMGLELLPAVEKVVPIMAPYKLASREARGGPGQVPVGNTVFGGPEMVVIAGPCAVESEEQLMVAAARVGEAGARILRGGAYKPRTSPYSFQGLEKDGLELLARVGRKTGLATVSEVMDRESLDQAVAYVDMLQVGARNMQNFKLLKAVGRTGKPVLLKRGLSATIEEWLMAAEYIMTEGNGNVVLCERGIRTFESYTRNTLDLSAIPLVKRLSHLPVIVDPSHATGDRRLVPPMAAAATAAGADGLLIEVHPDPPRALCDGAQSLDPGQFASLMITIKQVAAAVGREV